MIPESCKCGRRIPAARVYPIVMSCCGVKYGEREASPLPEPTNYAGVGTRLKRMLGCGCSEVPFRKWDDNGVQWCSDHREDIVSVIVASPKANASEDAARRMVDRAIKECET